MKDKFRDGKGGPIESTSEGPSPSRGHTTNRSSQPPPGEILPIVTPEMDRRMQEQEASLTEDPPNLSTRFRLPKTRIKTMIHVELPATEEIRVIGVSSGPLGGSIRDQERMSEPPKTSPTPSPTTPTRPTVGTTSSRRGAARGMDPVGGPNESRSTPRLPTLSDSMPDYHLLPDMPPPAPQIPTQDRTPGAEVVHWLRGVHAAEVTKDHRTSDTGPDLVLMRIEIEEALIAEHFDMGGICWACQIGYPCRTQYLLAAGWRHHEGYRSEWAELAYWWRGPIE